MFSFIFGCPLGRFPPFSIFHSEGPITAKGLEALWACGTTRSLSLNLKKCRGVEETCRRQLASRPFHRILGNPT
ncbi:uncharacterized protein LOC26526854 [Drosophila erecta]|uniref:uncharacterized protein LOC26526854 n=1 Tax=Drosophila erecta TaxID=7220 RepID=UPI000732B3C6|nr:uncharacterized protein LOC26526854 [Drosophila erecta]KQS39471.1 uncharacterized protein Dere_GG27030 [Drosophila erecta]